MVEAVLPVEEVEPQLLLTRVGSGSFEFTFLALCHIVQAFNAVSPLITPPSPLNAILIFQILDSNASPNDLPPI